MTEPIIFTEMVDAGAEALAECEAAGADCKTMAIHVYLAMESMRAMKLLIPDNASVH